MLVILAGACSVAADNPVPTTGGSVPPITLVASPQPTTATTLAEVIATTIPPATTEVVISDPVIAVTVLDGEVTSVFSQSVTLGSHVVITINSDVADEVHLHTYDLKGDVVADGQLVFEFDADIAGIFEMELEGSHLQILELTVAP